MDNRPIKSKNNESGTITALLTSAEVTSAHLSPVPENAPGIFVMNPGTTEEEHIFYKERDAVLGAVSGLVRDIENQNGGVGREAQANAPWETLQSARYLNNIIDILIEGYLQETNDVAYVSAASFTVKTNRSTFYTKGRVVRFDDGAIAVVSADSTYAAGTGLTTVLVTGTVPSDLATVEIGIQHKGRTDIFASGSDVNTGTDPYKIVTPKAIQDSYLSNGYNSLFRQAIINGNFDVWQRATSAAGGAGGSYMSTADRWQNFRGAAVAGATYSRQDGTGVVGSRYCIRCQRDSGNTNTNEVLIAQSIETENSIKFRGQKVTLSFYARKGANYSATSDVITATILARTVADESYAANGGGSIASSNGTLTTSWQKFTLTTSAVIQSDINTVKVVISGKPTGTAGAADYFEITQVQLCAGDVALPFMPKSYEEELDDCFRYYQGTLEVGFSAYITSGESYYHYNALRKPMRATPTITTLDGSNSNFPAGNPPAEAVTPSSFRTYKVSNGTGRGYFLYSYTASAEL